MPDRDVKWSVIAMPRTGHNAVRSWMQFRAGGRWKNVEGYFFEDSMKMAEGDQTMAILVLRDYPNWVASWMSLRPKWTEEQLGLAIDMWITHAEAAFTIPTVIYHQWVLAGHGQTAVGASSSFSSGSVFTRYEQVDDDPRREYAFGRMDAIELSDRVIGIPDPDLLEKTA